MKRSTFAGVRPARRVRDLALPEAIDAVARFTGPPEDPVDAAIARALAAAPDGLAGQARLLREVLPPPVYALLHLPLGSLGPGDVDELDAFLEPGGRAVPEFLRALLAGEAAA
ncbi:hypothetical protein ACPPVO_17990 [Dactylosporangium sp. McL0621]|uniref:hypothetical protein n=1 Tax=Dactylosporangium sp. McL0621 TaxID=3415678 RepID=UPI003CF98C04